MVQIIFKIGKTASLRVTVTNFSSQHNPSQISGSLLISRFNSLHWTMLLAVLVYLDSKSGFAKTRVKVGSLQNIQ